MSGRLKPKLGAEETEELISEVNASDRQQARAAIADGVRAAENQWLEARFIAEALALELMSVSRRADSPIEVAAHLRALADVLEAQVDVH